MTSKTPKTLKSTPKIPTGSCRCRCLCLHKFLSLCASLSGSLILTPILLSIAVGIWLIRLLISGYLRVLKPKVKLIDSMDSFQVFDKPNNTLDTYTLVVLRGEADLEKIRGIFHTRIINSGNTYEKLKCKISKKFGFYCWEDLDEEFQLENHVRMENCDVDNENCWTEQKVFSRLGEMYSHPMRIDEPRWELVIFPNFLYKNEQNQNKDKDSNKNECEYISVDLLGTGGKSEIDTDLDLENGPHYAIIFRAHHSLMDGISIHLLLSQGIEGVRVQSGIDPLKPIHIPLLARLLSYLKLLLTWPQLIYENIAVPPEENCFHGPELTDVKHISWSREFTLESLRPIRQAYKCTTVALLNACVGGAFKQVALKKGGQVPEVITAVTAIPMLPYPNIKPQNRFSGAFFPLQVGNGVGRPERIRSTNETLKKMAKSPLILMNSFLLRFIGILPTRWSQNMTDSRELTVLTSNLPGPGEKMRIFGDEVVDIGGWVPIKNKTGFGFCFVSYCGKIRASIVADSAVASAKDVEMLVEAFETEIADLEMSLGPDVNLVNGEQWV